MARNESYALKAMGWQTWIGAKRKKSKLIGMHAWVRYQNNTNYTQQMVHLASLR